MPRLNEYAYFNNVQFFYNLCYSKYIQKNSRLLLIFSSVKYLTLLLSEAVFIFKIALSNNFNQLTILLSLKYITWLISIKLKRYGQNYIYRTG
jgi:hypothetical protein